jgi:hypothetical protein
MRGGWRFPRVESTECGIISENRKLRNPNFGKSEIRHSGMVRWHQIRNFEIRGSMLRIAPE